MGTAKLAIVAYDARTRMPVIDSGTPLARADYKQWNVMGAGNWATDPLYAGKVLTIYSRMLTFKAALPK